MFLKCEEMAVEGQNKKSEGAHFYDFQSRLGKIVEEVGYGCESWILGGPGACPRYGHREYSSRYPG